MLKTLTLRMAACTLLAFSCGVALAAGPGDAGRSPATSAAAGGAEAADDTTAATEKRARLPRPRRVPSRTPSETVRVWASAGPHAASPRGEVSGDAHDRYTNAETSYLLD